jgi:hypothetical protein
MPLTPVSLIALIYLMIMVLPSLIVLAFWSCFPENSVKKCLTSSSILEKSIEELQQTRRLKRLSAFKMRRRLTELTTIKEEA